MKRQKNRQMSGMKLTSGFYSKIRMLAASSRGATDEKSSASEIHRANHRVNPYEIPFFCKARCRGFSMPELSTIYDYMRLCVAPHKRIYVKMLFMLSSFMSTSFERDFEACNAT